MDVDFEFDGTHSGFCLKGLTATIFQGTLVAVCGPGDAGKKTLFHLLGHVITPTRGLYFVPPHLRVLHVSAVPEPAR